MDKHMPEADLSFLAIRCERFESIDANHHLQSECIHSFKLLLDLRGQIFHKCSRQFICQEGLKQQLLPKRCKVLDGKDQQRAEVH
jgi:hypothetical protein